MDLVCASANPDKVAEIAEILAQCDVVEDSDTLEGNARLKAIAIAEATGLPAVADDTGLEVDALDGAPGVRSARYAGDHASYEDNVDLLLRELATRGIVEPGERTARFRTVVILRWPDGRELVVNGVCEGTITSERSGDGGFGYDPVFAPDDADGRTFAQLSPIEKHAISHRGRALRALAESIEIR